MSKWNDEVERDVKGAIPAGIARQVLEPQFERSSATPSIRIMTPDYPKWLARMDPNRTQHVKESVKDFLRWRRKYHEEMTALLDAINFYDAGSALIVEISRSTHELFMRPYTVYGPQGKIGAHAAVLGDREAWLDATSTGMPNYGPDGTLKTGSGRGKGAHAHVDFSPDMWDGARRQPGSQDADAFDAIHSNLQGRFHLGIEGGGGMARKQQCANRRMARRESAGCAPQHVCESAHVVRS